MKAVRTLDNAALSTAGVDINITDVLCQCVPVSRLCFATYGLHKIHPDLHGTAICCNSTSVPHPHTACSALWCYFNSRHLARMIVTVSVMVLATLLPAPAMAKDDSSIYRSKSKSQVLSSNWQCW